MTAMLEGAQAATELDGGIKNPQAGEYWQLKENGRIMVVVGNAAVRGGGYDAAGVRTPQQVSFRLVNAPFIVDTGGLQSGQTYAQSLAEFLKKFETTGQQAY
jgi:hypothetical protein